MKFAVIDTETNGLPDYKKPADDPIQPRLASIGIFLLNEKLEIDAQHELFVKPDGWAMTPEATAINGLTDELLSEKGQPIREVLEIYTKIIDLGYFLAAYGAQHDLKIMRGELRRASIPDRFEATPNICLMRAAMKLKVKKESGTGGWPKLADVCKHFGIERAAAHTGLGDAMDALAILREMAKLKMLPVAAVHYAKNKPEGL